jgi:hypothetical protein
MENYHKDTKHKKANDERNLVLVCWPSCFPSLCLRAFVVNLSALSEEAIDCV